VQALEIGDSFAGVPPATAWHEPRAEAHSDGSGSRRAGSWFDQASDEPGLPSQRVGTGNGSLGRAAAAAGVFFRVAYVLSVSECRVRSCRVGRVGPEFVESIEFCVCVQFFVGELAARRGYAGWAAHVFRLRVGF